MAAGLLRRGGHPSAAVPFPTTSAGYRSGTHNRAAPATLKAQSHRRRARLAGIAVSPGARGDVGELGVLSALARPALIDALHAGLRKLVVEVVADQEAAIHLFTGLGFTPEAILGNQVRDRAGEVHDLMVLAHDVEDVQSVIATTSIDNQLSQ